MILQSIQQRLFELQDKDYADFQSKLIPTLDREQFIGVRVPVLRNLAKEIAKEKVTQGFLEQLPHQYYDENILHAILLSEIKEYDRAIIAVERFLPYIDNWAVCDILSPKIFKKNRANLFNKIQSYLKSKHIYSCRFAVVMLMNHYLDENFKEEYLTLPSTIKSEEYYVNMALAWFYATALAKQWDATIPYLIEQRLPLWVHNKTLQKSRESFRITAEQKAYLKTLKRSR